MLSHLKLDFIFLIHWIFNNRINIFIGLMLESENKPLKASFTEIDPNNNINVAPNKPINQYVLICLLNTLILGKKMIDKIKLMHVNIAIITVYIILFPSFKRYIFYHF